MADKHTPGLLHLMTVDDMGWNNETYWYLECAAEARDGMDFPEATTIVDPESGILTEADACRLVACWNACESLPTEALEGGVVEEMLEAALKLANEASGWNEGDLVGIGGWTNTRCLQTCVRKVSIVLAKSKPTGGEDDL
ncbi:hypothetical protein LCGC14_0354880 [marine sediment metagenome]|uniref:Uncharacterized protein n=1 Tax=marine sediment metagenome TaxID=412755 RepID=A0A0F9WHQ9_9ZZZZ